MKTWKRFLTACLSVAVLVCCVLLMPVEAEAANVVDSGECGANGNNVIWSLDDAGTLTISGSGRMKNFYSSETNPWYKHQANVTAVVIQEGVTNIGAYAFSPCFKLERIHIADSVTGIGSGAFQGCAKLLEVNLPKSLRAIGSSAFEECYSLTEVIIPNGITVIEMRTFYGCTNLMSVHIPDSVTSIKSYAFYCCRALTSVALPNGISIIERATFYDCKNLASINIPNTVVSIKEHAFSGCGLTSINIPNGVVRIEMSAFEFCSQLESAVVADSVAYIGASAFRCCNKLESFVIPSGINEIYYGTFQSCDKLAVVTISDSVTTIHEEAFSDIAHRKPHKVWHVLYKGTETQWNSINGNNSIAGATTHYNCAGNEVTDLANRVCSVCLANCTHKWDGGTVTKQASCSAAGEKTFTCTLCSQTKAETVAKLAHSYTNGCDASCNVCSESRSVSHTYDTKWSSDATNHWHACTSCGEKKDAAKHTPGAAATETTAQTCTTCGYVLKKALGHTHAYGSDWKSDGTNHWHVCACGAKADEAAHTWESGKTNADGSKLFTCTACKATKTEAAPSGGTADGNTSGSGSSGNTETPGSGSGSSDSSGTPGSGSGSSGSTDTPGTGDSSSGSGSADTPTDIPTDIPADDNGKEDGGNNTVIIIVAAVVVLGGGGAAAWYVLSKKKK